MNPLVREAFMSAGRVEVTSADIARLAGVRPAAVSNWRRRHDDFPAPVGGTDRSPRFDLAEVEAWLAAHGSRDPIDPERRLLQAFDSVRETMPGDQALGTVGLLLLHLHRNPDTAVPSDPDRLSALLTDAERDFTAIKRMGPGVENMAAQRLQPDLGSRMCGLLVTAAKAARRTGAASVFESLVLHAESTAGPSARTVPWEVADLMVVLLGDPKAEFIDPACGRGQILLAAARRGWRRIRAQEREHANAWTAALRLAFTEDLRSAPHVDVHADDALRSPAFPMGRADAVAFVPLVGDRNWGLEDLEHDRRWVYGVPPRLESELAWVQHALAQVRPGGRVVAMMPPAVAERGSGRRIRQRLVRAGAVRAVVSLPAGLAAYHSLPLHLWILTRPGEEENPVAPVLFIDAEDIGVPRNAEEWTDVTEKVVALWEEFHRHPEAFPERPGRARAVSPLDLIDDAVDLTPRRHLPLRFSLQESELRLKRTREGVLRLLTECRETVAAPPSLPELDYTPTHYVTVEQLVERGAMIVRRPQATWRAGDSDSTVPEETRSGRILTAEDLIEGRPPSGIELVDADPMRNPSIRKGDVLVPAVARRPVARVAEDEETGAYPGPNVYVLRPDELVVDPWFLAGMLSTGEGARQIARASSSIQRALRIDPRRLRLPVLPIEIQRRFGAEFRRAARFTKLLHSIRETGDDLVEATNTLLTAPFTGNGDRKTPTR